MLFLAFAYTQGFQLVLYAVVLVVGILVGLEIPLLMRILKDRFQFRELVARVLTFDYLGALGVSMLFPILLVPKLGLVRVGAVVRAAQRGCRAVVHVAFSGADRARLRPADLPCVAVTAALAVACSMPGRISAAADNNLYADDVIFSRNTRYQRIVLTRWKDDLRLFLNSHLQFSSRDEYRYHEALVHPGLARIARRAARSGAGRRRRARGARDPEVSGGRERHAGGSRSRDDAAVLHASGCSPR